MFDTPSFYLYDSNDVKYKTDSGISANGADVFEVSAERIEEGQWKLKIVADNDIIIPIE